MWQLFNLVNSNALSNKVTKNNKEKKLKFKKNFPLSIKSNIFKRIIYVLGAFLVSTPAFASAESSLPFMQGLETFKDVISGPFLLCSAIILIVVTCLMNAFNHGMGTGMKVLVGIGFWLGIAMTITSGIAIIWHTSGAVC